jgi:hypothetical protein
MRRCLVGERGTWLVVDMAAESVTAGERELAHDQVIGVLDLVLDHLLG